RPRPPWRPGLSPSWWTRDVVDADVGHPMRRRARRLIDRHAAAGARADLDHRIRASARHRLVLELPLEELRVELARPLDIVGVQLHVHEWVAHWDYLLGRSVPPRSTVGHLPLHPARLVNHSRRRW